MEWKCFLQLLTTIKPFYSLFSIPPSSTVKILLNCVASLFTACNNITWGMNISSSRVKYVKSCIEVSITLSPCLPFPPTPPSSFHPPFSVDLIQKDRRFTMTIITRSTVGTYITRRCNLWYKKRMHAWWCWWSHKLILEEGRMKWPTTKIRGFKKHQHIIQRYPASLREVWFHSYGEMEKKIDDEEENQLK